LSLSHSDGRGQLRADFDCTGLAPLGLRSSKNWGLRSQACAPPPKCPWAAPLRPGLEDLAPLGLKNDDGKRFVPRTTDWPHTASTPRPVARWVCP
jgi:hypothetical protein